LVSSFVASRELLLGSYPENGKLEFQINLRTSTFNIVSPIFLGSVGGGVILTIVIIIIACKCRNTEEVKAPEPVVQKVEVANQIDLSLDKSKAKLNDISTKDKDIKINNTEKETGRKLVVTSTELKQQKIDKLLEEFSNKLKEKYSSQHDKCEFFKPYSNNAINDLATSNRKDGLSNISKMTDITRIQKNDKACIDELVYYTNGKRDYPSNSFYDEKLEEMNRIEEMELDEEIKTQKREENEEQKEIEEVEIEQNFDEDDDDEELEYIEKEHDKHNLQPDCEDVISDFKEKTIGVRIEIHKKNTKDFEKESEERKKKKKKINNCPSSERILQKKCLKTKKT